MKKYEIEKQTFRFVKLERKKRDLRDRMEERRDEEGEMRRQI